MSPIDQVLAAARALEANGKTPSLALLKTRLGSSLPLPLLIQGLQQFKAMPKAERERLGQLPTDLQAQAPAAPKLEPGPETIAQLAEQLAAQLEAQLATQQAHFAQLIAQQQGQIVQLQNELLELKQRLNLIAPQGSPL
ncbi:MAG: DNA-binding protein [Shewanella sp.]